MDRVTKLVDQLTDEEIDMLRAYIANPYRVIAKAEIPYKFPSFNEYIRTSRSDKFRSNDLKRRIQNDISWFLRDLPVVNNPVFIDLTWVEGDHRRDWDNVIFAKKFILDALVALGKLSDDGRKYVKGFSEQGIYQKGVWKVIVEIREIEEGEV